MAGGSYIVALMSLWEWFIFISLKIQARSQAKSFGGAQEEFRGGIRADQYVVQSTKWGALDPA